jgi:hypothetical protein
LTVSPPEKYAEVQQKLQEKLNDGRFSIPSIVERLIHHGFAYQLEEIPPIVVEEDPEPVDVPRPDQLPEDAYPGTMTGRIPATDIAGFAAVPQGIDLGPIAELMDRVHARRAPPFEPNRVFQPGDPVTYHEVLERLIAQRETTTRTADHEQATAFQLEAQRQADLHMAEMLEAEVRAERERIQILAPVEPRIATPTDGPALTRRFTPISWGVRPIEITPEDMTRAYAYGPEEEDRPVLDPARGVAQIQRERQQARLTVLEEIRALQGTPVVIDEETAQFIRTMFPNNELPDWLEVW